MEVRILLYLNGGCEGGDTRFYLPDHDTPLDFSPVTGAALLFLHSFQHEGTPVTAGEKYVLRSDVFYRAA